MYTATAWKKTSLNLLQLLEKQRWTQKRRFLHDSCTGAEWCWLYSKYLHQLCAEIRCSLEDLPGAMNDRYGWWERESQGSMCLSVRFDDDDDYDDYCVQFIIIRKENVKLYKSVNYLYLIGILETVLLVLLIRLFQERSLDTRYPENSPTPV